MQPPTLSGVIVISWMGINFVRHIEKKKKISFFVVKKLDIQNACTREIDLILFYSLQMNSKSNTVK